MRHVEHDDPYVIGLQALTACIGSVLAYALSRGVGGYVFDGTSLVHVAASHAQVLGLQVLGVLFLGTLAGAIAHQAWKHRA